MEILWKGFKINKAVSPVIKWDTLPFKASSKNLSSLGSRPSFTVSEIRIQYHKR